MVKTWSFGQGTRIGWKWKISAVVYSLVYGKWIIQFLSNNTIVKVRQDIGLINISEMMAERLLKDILYIFEIIAKRLFLLCYVALAYILS